MPICVLEIRLVAEEKTFWCSVILFDHNLKLNGQSPIDYFDATAAILNYIVPILLMGCPRGKCIVILSP